MNEFNRILLDIFVRDNKYKVNLFEELNLIFDFIKKSKKENNDIIRKFRSYIYYDF